MTSRTAVALAALLSAALVLVSAAAFPAVAVSDARVTVSDVTVAPATPVTGAPVTVTITVANGGGSPEAVEIDSVRLEDGDRTLDRARNPGSLSPGESLTLSLTRTFEEPGPRSLSVVVRGTDEDGDSVDVTRPLSVVVESAPPLIEFGNASRAVVGAATTQAVVVSNPTASPMRNLVVSVEAADAERVVDRRTVASLAAGAASTLNFTVRYREAGETSLSVRVNYTTASGTRATTSLARAVAVESLDDDVGVRVDPRPPEEVDETQPQGQLGALLGGGAPSTGATRDQDDGGQPANVAVTVSNFGNAPLSDVVVTPRVGEATLPRVLLEEPIPPGREATVDVSLDRAPAGAVTFDVSYRVAGGEGQASTSFDNRPGRGAVRLTGLNLSVTTADASEDRLLVRLSGNAGNPGQTPVTGVVLAVGENEHVTPAYPQRDYFVGTVDGSEFAPFELRASVDTNATSIPVVVTYAVDGVAREETVDVPLDTSLDAERSGLSLSLLSALVATAVVGVGLAVVVGVRRGRLRSRLRLPDWSRRR